MEDLIKFQNYAASLGFNVNKLTFQEVVNLHIHIKKELTRAFDPLSQVQRDLEEMNSQKLLPTFAA